MCNIQGDTGLTSQRLDCNKPILTTSEYIGRTRSIKADTRIMNKIRDRTDLTSQGYDRNKIMLTTSGCIVSRACTQLVKLDIGHLRHCEIFTMSQCV
jgi:hypothetical protein